MWAGLLEDITEWKKTQLTLAESERRFRDLAESVPIIAPTANAITGEREKCLADGMNDYPTKPFQEAALIQMVHD